MTNTRERARELLDHELDHMQGWRKAMGGGIFNEWVDHFTIRLAAALDAEWNAALEAAIDQLSRHPVIHDEDVIAVTEQVEDLKR